MIIAVVGKGGTGKTTISSLLVRAFLGRRVKPLLAIDADPNSCLGAMLGTPPEQTIGGLREECLRHKHEAPAGVSKQEMIEVEVQKAVTEAKGFDLLTMGRSEGPGCYCYINNLLRAYIDQLGRTYRMVVIDNEAGMEHLSRRTNVGVDVMVFVCNPSRSSVRTVTALSGLADNLSFRIGRKFAVLNRAVAASADDWKKPLAEAGLEPLGAIPEDPAAAEFESQGQSLLDLEDRRPAARAVDSIVTKILEGEKHDTNASS